MSPRLPCLFNFSCASCISWLKINKRGQERPPLPLLIRRRFGQNARVNQAGPTSQRTRLKLAVRGAVQGMHSDSVSACRYFGVCTIRRRISASNFRPRAGLPRFWRTTNLPRTPREKSYSARMSISADLADGFFIKFPFAPARAQNANGKTFGQFRVASQSRERSSRADSTAKSIAGGPANADVRRW
jgi:hypothetical protein